MSYSGDKVVRHGSGGSKRRRDGGFILLIVLMAMIVLALLAIEFQQEAFLQVRMSKHRQDVIQCDYALESGLAAAGKLIQEYHEEMFNRIRHPQPQVSDDAAAGSDADLANSIVEQAKINELLEQLSAGELDPNSLDPNMASLLEGLTDPNSSMGQAPEEWKEHLLKHESIEVGKAEAEVYVYGENYKLPLIWALQSPFSRSTKTSSGLSMVSELLGSLDKGSTCEPQTIISFLQDLTEDIEISYCPKVSFNGKKWNLSGKSYSNDEVNLRTEKNHMIFAAIGEKWYKTVNDERHPEVKDIFTLASGNMVSDYIGLWGGIKVNINTAPVEVIAAAFKDAGMTMELAEQLVEYRKTHGLIRTAFVLRTEPGFETIYKAMAPLVDVIDHVYTVRIVARCGQVNKSKSACFYRNGKKLKILAVY